MASTGERKPDRSPRLDGGSPQDLVEAVDRLEAEEEEVLQELGGGILPNSSRDLDEVIHFPCNNARLQRAFCQCLKTESMD